MPEHDIASLLKAKNIVTGPIFDLECLSVARPPDDPLFNFLAEADSETLDRAFAASGIADIGEYMCENFSYAHVSEILSKLGGYLVLAWVRVPPRHSINLNKMGEDPSHSLYLRFCGYRGKSLAAAFQGVIDNAARISGAAIARNKR